MPTQSDNYNIANGAAIEPPRSRFWGFLLQTNERLEIG
jgi:hypothetical protein